MAEQDPAAPEQESIPPHAGLQYALLRLLLMLAVAGVLFLLGMRSWPWLFVTVLVSAVLSFFVLARQREAAARSLQASVSARAARRDAAAPPSHADPAPNDPAQADPS